MSDTSPLDIRWKQRLENLGRAYKQLAEIREAGTQFRPVEIAGWIHLFDLAFELSWKTMRDYLIAHDESERMDFTRDILQIALMRGLITESDTWIRMLVDRNTSTCEYDEKAALKVVESIRSSYLGVIETLYHLLLSRSGR